MICKHVFSIRVKYSVDSDHMACQKPADLDLQCFSKKDKRRFSRTRVNSYPKHSMGTQDLRCFASVCTTHMLFNSAYQSCLLIAFANRLDPD